MAIEIDGGGTITGVSVGGLPDGIVDTDMIAANAVVTGKITDGTIVSGDIAANTITSGDLAATVTDPIAKVWIKMDGTGTISINGSYGVSSITDNGTGDYTISFSSAFSDTNYCVVTGLASYSLGDADRRWPTHVEAIATGSITVHNAQVANNGALVDSNFICLAIFDS